MSGRPPVPGLVSGTSAEYLGRRPLRKLLVERPVVLVMGPAGSGKTAVARRVASHDETAFRYLATQELEEALEQTARRRGRWSTELLEVPVLVLDGPRYLSTRATVRRFLAKLIKARTEAGLRSIVCEIDDDGSGQMLQDVVPPGLLVTVALRFPQSRSGRMRVARRIAEHLGLPKSAAQGTDVIEPWRYDAVVRSLIVWRDTQDGDRTDPDTD